VLGDRFGRKGALVWGLGLFGAGALFAGVSTSTGHVIGARAVMGVATGFVMPATLSIITTVFPPADSRPSAATHQPTRRPGFAAATGGRAH
jgi:MFS family permease